MTEDAHDSDPAGLVRETAPQQPYSMREVWAGFAVLAVGLAITVLLPLFG